MLQEIALWAHSKNSVFQILDLESQKPLIVKILKRL